jgi:hypothetical protein
MAVEPIPALICLETVICDFEVKGRSVRIAAIYASRSQGPALSKASKDFAQVPAFRVGRPVLRRRSFCGPLQIVA